jgi:hypothetical protein
LKALATKRQALANQKARKGPRKLDEAQIKEVRTVVSLPFREFFHFAFYFCFPIEK